jgi:hypothetical protein
VVDVTPPLMARRCKVGDNILVIHGIYCGKKGIVGRVTRKRCYFIQDHSQFVVWCSLRNIIVLNAENQDPPNEFSALLSFLNLLVNADRRVLQSSTPTSWYRRR